jgi:dienelactone hydrolase
MKTVAIWVVLAACSGFAGCAAQVEFPSSAAKLTLRGALYRPERTGPLPAVVLLPPCGGVNESTGAWAGWLKDQGYVAFVVDSFSPRGARNACQGGPPSVAAAARDATDALAHLKTLPFVDGERVALIGWSHGAAATLVATGIYGHPSFGPGSTLVFAAAVAYYPDCFFFDGRTETPTLLLLAGRDDWTPPAQCLHNADVARGRGTPVSWEVYPQAQHAFDRPLAAPYLGHVMAYDANAAAASREAVRRFLAERLQSRRPGAAPADDPPQLVRQRSAVQPYSHSSAS